MNKSAMLLLVLIGGGVEAADIQSLLDGYEKQGAGPFRAAAGEQLWNQPGQNKRLCRTCHGADLTQPGEHARTGKPIEPIAPSAQPDRLADPAKVEKWLLRNCKWTFGRECSAQEKGDLLSFLNLQ